MPTPTLVDRVLALARAELEAGVAESGGPNAGLPSTRYMGGRCEPWCSWFVLWLFREAGAPIPGDVPPDGNASALAGVEHLERVFESHGWLARKPMRGDLVFFAGRGGSDHGPGRHVGIVERVGLSTVDVISGNEGDAVKRTTYRAAGLDALITSYGRVPDVASTAG